MARQRTSHATGLAAVVLLVVQAIAAPVASAATSPFTDIAGHRFEADIDWLFAEGITRGCTETTYCPDDSLTRAQLAAFFVRAFDLQPSTTDAFTDDDGSPFESQIDSLAASGITAGCTETTFCPSAPVTREQMASFLVRALELTDGAGRDYFRDDADLTGEDDIDRLAAAGLTAGCNTWTYCPEGLVTRGEVAAMLHRGTTPLGSDLDFPAPDGALSLHVGVAGVDAANDCTMATEPCRTIRRALQLTLDGDTISIGAGLFREEDLVLDTDLTMTGDPEGTVIDAAGGPARRVLTIWQNTTVRLEQLTITGGRSEDGGGIWTAGDLTLVASTVLNNRATRSGGGLATADANVVVIESVIRSNHADASGGGISASGGTLLIERTSVRGNDADRDGGALDAFFTDVTLDRASIRDNQADFGGGMSLSDGVVTIRDSTIAFNDARVIGGLHLSDLIENQDLIVGTTFNHNAGAEEVGGVGIYGLTNVTFANVTLSGNGAPIASAVACGVADSGPLGNGIWLVNATVTRNGLNAFDGPAIDLPGSVGPVCAIGIRNSIVAGNAPTGGGDVGNNVGLDSATSLIGLPSGTTLSEVLDSGLLPNGGSTSTVALIDDPSNPARGTASASICAAAPIGGVDQRGLPRTGTCDMGAYEVQP